MVMEEIKNVVDEVEALGVRVWLKENGAIGLRGQLGMTQALALAVSIVTPHKEEIKVFLEWRQQPPPPCKWEHLKKWERLHPWEKEQAGEPSRARRYLEDKN